MTAMFALHDGGHSASKRPKQKNDCTVRALALATGLSYDAAYDLLATAGRKCGSRFQFKSWVDQTVVNGRKFARRTFPAVAGQKRMNPVTFCEQHRNGVYIINTAHHVATVIDGVLHDDMPMRPDRCIYGCWQVTAC